MPARMPVRKRAASSMVESPRRSRRVSTLAARSKYFDNGSDDETDDHDKGEYDDKKDQSRSSRRRLGAVKTAAREKKPNARSAPKSSRTGHIRKKRRTRDADEDEEKDEHKDDVGDDYKDNDSEEHEKVEDDDDDDDDDRRVTILPIQQLRPDGGVEYADEKLHRNTLLFLRDLKRNNKRSWLKSHDGEYRRSFKDWQTFVESFTPKIIEIDETIPELPFKDVMFRVYRDTRFSKDPTPYKPYYSAAWSRTGRKGPYACYYIHVEPGSCFVGGGLWHPDNGALAKIRRSIDEHPHLWRRVLNDDALKREFLPTSGLSGDVAETAVRAFVQKNKQGALKKRPAGFDAEHRDIELLRLKNFTLGKQVDDGLFETDDGQEKIARMIKAIACYITFLNSIVMPDANLDESEDD